MLGTTLVLLANAAMEPHWEVLLEAAAFGLNDVLEAMMGEPVDVKETLQIAKTNYANVLVKKGILTAEERDELLELSSRFETLLRKPKPDEDNLDPEIWSDFKDLLQ